MSSVRAIYAGTAALGMREDEERRDFYERVTGKRRLREMTPQDRAALVEELRRLGFRAKPGAARRPAAPRADLRYAHVLWRLLAEAGAVRKPGPAGLNAFARARFGAAWGTVPIDVDALRDRRQIADLVEALKEMCARAGIPAAPPGGR
ncbi:MAG: phage protein GemA/Gp16 family protein [Gemmobacter sp.]